jgi:hypothetical protein
MSGPEIPARPSEFLQENFRELSPPIYKLKKINTHLGLLHLKLRA